jgi:hypothetical protein
MTKQELQPLAAQYAKTMQLLEKLPEYDGFSNDEKHIVACIARQACSAIYKAFSEKFTSEEFMGDMKIATNDMINLTGTEM